MIDWNPDLYLKFGKERTLPAKDLISRIGLENPARIKAVKKEIARIKTVLTERENADKE